MKYGIVLMAILFVFGCNPRDAGNISRDAGNLAKSTAQAAGSAQLAARVNSVLVQRKGIDMSGLHIEAQDGVVTVGGHVRNAEEKRRVLDTVEGVRGVDRVVDKLRIEPKS
ncbi:MAG TPA: BON domain-containing protein [Fimbriimonas sp.]